MPGASQTGREGLGSPLRGPFPFSPEGPRRPPPHSGRFAHWPAEGRMLPPPGERGAGGGRPGPPHTRELAARPVPSRPGGPECPLHGVPAPGWSAPLPEDRLPRAQLLLAPA